MSWDGVERSKEEMHAISDARWKRILDACTDPQYAVSIQKLWENDKALIEAGVLRISPLDSDTALEVKA